MDNAALFRVVMGQTVPLVRQLFAASVGGCGYGGFAFSSADVLDAAMIDCDVSPPFRSFSLGGSFLDFG